MNPLLSAMSRYLRFSRPERRKSSARGRPRRRTQLWLEALEDRCLLSGTPSLEITGVANVDQGAEYFMTLGPIDDADPDHVIKDLTIHWGDNSSSTFTRQEYVQIGSNIEHTYLDAGAQQISVDITVKPDNPFTGVATKSITVANVAPSASAQVFARTGSVLSQPYRLAQDVAHDPATG